MKINVKELQEKLSKLMPGLSGRSPIKDIKHFVFLGDEIITYNDQVCIGIPFVTEFSCSVPADELLSILSSIKEEEIDIVLENDNIKFLSLSTKAQISTMSDNQLITLIKTLDIPEEGWKPIPEEFIKAISLCVFSTSKDMTMGVLNCVALQHNDVVSSDRFRISGYTMKESMGDIGMSSILIPAVAVKDLIKYPIVNFCVQGSWIHFQTKDGLIFSARILLDTYPNLLDFLNLQAITIEIPGELKDILDSIDIFTKEDFEIDKAIEIQINTNKLICKASNRSGWIEKTIKIDYKKEPLVFSINPIFLSQILEKTTTMQISLDQKRALFTSGSFRHLMVLQGE